MYTPGTFQTTVPMLYLLGVICCAICKGKDSVSCCPLALPELSLLILKYPELSPADWKTCKVKLSWLSKPSVMGIRLPSADPLCLGCLVWGLFLFSVLVVSCPFVVTLTRSLVPDHVSAPPTFFDVASSLQLTVESVLPVFWSFSGLVSLM